MKICSNCKTNLGYDDYFCPVCGTKYEEPAARFCSNCGTELLEDANFCLNCGTPVDQYQAGPARKIQPAGTPYPAYNAPGAQSFNNNQYQQKSAPQKAEHLRAAMGPSGTAYQIENAGTYSAPQYEPANTEAAAAAAAAADSSSKSTFYLADFARSLIQSHNVPVIIYLILNIFIIWGIFFLMFGGNVLASFLGAMICYTLSVAIALSPVGENLLRWQTGCKPIDREEIRAKIEPLFNEARNRAVIEARKEGLSIPEDIQLFINEDENPNAFATGRKTICFTRGLLFLPEDQIIATLCHEFGHIAHHDTDSILLITVGNMIVTAFMTLVKIMTVIGGAVMAFMSALAGGSEGFVGRIFSGLYTAITIAVINFLMWVWTQLGTMLVMKSMREHEYLADRFAFNCGYGDPLCALLDALNAGTKKETGLFATLMSTHPDSDKRIAALQQLGATYRGCLFNN